MNYFYVLNKHISKRFLTFKYLLKIQKIQLKDRERDSMNETFVIIKLRNK